ncbi:energy transducer TonB [Pedobacter frigiditerrae]|uniref:Energy transducer TonB n=1 Tax=Pedobacter frigiditerrae TaxID=2530452 RepID=A0A4R0N279_9SPHI|nr:energy transducer TonB [Pedobacter frigiditerrae]TCC93437.1 energy transducer TonB [Pedobacter frigiditerrae]
MKKLIYSSLIAVLLLTFCQKSAIAQDDEKIYNFVSIKNPPTYPGGLQAFYKFLGANIKYPEMAAKNNVQGKVLVSFVVEKDGSLTDIKIERSLGSGTDEETIRVLKLSRNWNPGIEDAKPVRVKYNIPVKFALAGGKANANTTNTVKSTDAVVEDNTVYNFVSMENPPKYPGGLDKLYKFLGENIKYPTEAKENKIQGKVLASFTVLKDGALADIKVERKLGYGTDEEAVRVLKLSKKWEPGLQNGKPVNVKYNIPISFNLAK